MAPPAVPPRPRADVLLGRGRELEVLAARVGALGPGPAEVVVLSGEAGIGKTALLTELATMAVSHGCTVLAGTAVELESDVPYTVIADALGPHGEGLDLASGSDGAPLLAVERHRGHMAVARVLEDLAAERPLVVTLDDLHWADPASVELVCHLLRRRPRGPLLIALAMRTAQCSETLTRTVQRAAREGGLVELALTPLGHEDCARLLGPGVAPERRRVIEELSGGNPLFLQQLARVEDGPGRSGAGLGEVPPAVRAAVMEEVGRLPAQARRVLEGAAVAGDPFAPEVAAAAADLEVPAALLGLDDLTRAGLVHPDGPGTHMRFRHPIVRYAVYEGTAGAWRVGAHARAARALGGDVQSRAHHLARSASPGDEDAVAVIEQAAAEARATAPAAAARWFEHARRLVPVTPETAWQRLALTMAAAGAHADAGDLARAADLLPEAIALTPEDQIEVRMQLTAACAGAERLLGRYESAEVLLLDGLAATRDADPRIAAGLRTELALGCIYRTGRFDMARGREWADRALADTDAGTAPGPRARAAMARALVECADGRMGDAEPYVRIARGIAAQMDDTTLATVLDLSFHLAWVECFLERFDDGLRYVRRGIEVSRRSHQGQLLLPLLITEAQLLTCAGRVDEAHERTTAVLEQARVAGNPQTLSWALAKHCLVELQHGDLGESRRLAEEALEMTQRHEVGTLSAAIAWSAAAALVESGEHERAATLILAEVGGPELTMVIPSFRPLCLELLTRAELGRGDIPAARHWAERATVVAHALGTGRRTAMAGRARAEVALAEDAPEAALHAAREGVADATAVGARADAATAAVIEGRALAALGRRDEALARLGWAESELSACGAGRGRDAAARELRKLGRRVARAGSRGEGPAHLSVRELQIAELVGEGLRNRDIAERLYLSERTVEDNLARIRRKLGVTSRAAIAPALERARRG